jgi:hypothetical protein
MVTIEIQLMHLGYGEECLLQHKENEFITVELFNMSKFLGWGQKIGHPGPRKLCQSHPSLKNFLNRRDVRQKVGASNRALAKGYLWRNAASCGPKIKDSRPVRGAFLHDKTPFRNL